MKVQADKGAKNRKLTHFPDTCQPTGRTFLEFQTIDNQR